MILGAIVGGSSLAAQLAEQGVSVGGDDEGDPCEAMAHHGFNGLDGKVVSVVAAFALH